jgi:DNA-binding MarR family transcriptional regulator
MLEVVGTFRAVWTRDLAIGTHGGDTHRLEGDVRSLTAQGLVQQRRVAADRHGQSVVAVSLTDAGKALVEHRRNPSGHASMDAPQAIYSGWVRPAELIHDASLYRMYLEEAARLAHEGRVVRRVVLDHELKGDLYQALHAHPAINKADRDARLAELAAAHHLPMVDGHVQLPDLRLEVDTAVGERTHVDLELTTEAYHAGQLRAKARAGFTMYRAVGAAGGAGRLVRGAGSSGRGSSASSPDYISSLLSL